MSVTGYCYRSLPDKLKAVLTVWGRLRATSVMESCLSYKNRLYDLPMYLQEVIELYALLASLHQSPAVLKLDDRPFFSMYYSKSVGVVHSVKRRFTYQEQVLMECNRVFEAIELDSIAWCLHRDSPRSLTFMH